MLDGSLNSPTDLWFRTHGEIPLEHATKFNEIDEARPGTVHNWPQEAAQDAAAFVALWTGLKSPAARIEVLAESHAHWVEFRGFILDCANSDAVIRALVRDCGPHRLMFGNSQVHKVRNNVPLANLQGMYLDMAVIIGANSKDHHFGQLALALEAQVRPEGRTIRLW